MPDEPSRQPSLYRPLPSGNRGIAPERVAEHQRKRLMGAMLHAVAEHGFPTVTVAELSQLAAVSHRAFYEHFADKEACFVATHDLAVAEGTARISTAYRARPDWREGLRAAFVEYFAIVSEEPRAAHLVIVDALNSGPQARLARHRAMVTFEQMLRESIAQAEGPGTVADAAIGAIVAGARRVVYCRLRAGRQVDLRQATEPMLEWALGLCDATRQVPWPELRPIRRRRRVATDPGDISRDARDRILDAVTEICAPEGYDALGMPAITSTARCSSQTFYRHFTDKDQAFLAAFDASGSSALNVLTSRSETAESWPQAVSEAVEALLEHVAVRPAQASMILGGILTGPATGMERADALLATVVAQFVPPPDSDASVPSPEIVDATVGAIAHLIQEQVGKHGAESLPALADQITYLIFVVTIGTRRLAHLRD